MYRHNLGIALPLFPARGLLYAGTVRPHRLVRMDNMGLRVSSVSHAGAMMVVQRDRGVSEIHRTIKVGSTEANLAVVARSPYNGHPFIEPGDSGLNGSQVWFRYGVAAASGNTTKECRFQAPLKVDLGNLGTILEGLGIIDAAQV